MRAVRALDVELVDQAVLVDHRLSEGVVVELLAEPAEPTGGSTLHLAKEADAQLRNLRSVDDPNLAFQGQPGERRIEHKEGAARIPAKPPRPHPILGAAAPHLAVDKGNPDPCRLGHSIGALGDHRGRVVPAEERKVVSRKFHLINARATPVVIGHGTVEDAGVETARTIVPIVVVGDMTAFGVSG